MVGNVRKRLKKGGKEDEDEDEEVARLGVRLASEPVVPVSRWITVGRYRILI